MKTVLEVVKEDLCTGCGICFAVCPNESIKLFENTKKGIILPEVDHIKCNKCGICLKVCPGINVNQPSLPSIGEKRDYLVGKYLRCYAGYATDQKTRYAASSGGLVTALAKFALERGWIDGVLTTKNNPENVLKPIPFIAKNESDLMLSTGSKYCPIPANVSVKEMLSIDGRYLVVGLPCHIQGVRNAGNIITKLRNRTVLCFGLSCGHTPTFHATIYLLRRLGISEKLVVQLNYRSKRYGGGVCIKMIDGSERHLAMSDPTYWGFVFRNFFWSSRCTLCEDKLCELADITFMDAWLPEFSSDTEGVSLIIVRTKRGGELIDNAMRAKIVSLIELPIQKIVNAQNMKAEVKNKVARKFVSARIFHRSLPSNRFGLKPEISDLISALYFTMLNKFCNNTLFSSRLIINCHSTVWNLLKSIKKLTRFFL